MVERSALSLWSPKELRTLRQAGSLVGLFGPDNRKYFLYWLQLFPLPPPPPAIQAAWRVRTPVSSLSISSIWVLPTKYVYIKSTTVYVSSSKIGTLPTPLSPASVPLPPEPGVGGYTRLRVRGWGSPNSDDLRKGLVLCLLCGPACVSGLLLQQRRH